MEISPTAASRFSGALSTGQCPRPIYDEVLFEVGDCVVAPTLGSILPDWLLVIPRVHVVNFAHWRRKTGIEPCLLVDDVARHCSISTDSALWFEHGASHPGSVLGCGVEHAHLHIIVQPPFTFNDLALAVQASSRLTWRAVSAKKIYCDFELATSYLVMAAGDQALLSMDVESVGSQFFRRSIARLVGQPETWDYRRHPHLEHVRQTVGKFRKQLG